MDFLPHVVRATHERGFRIRLKFNDGLEGSVDFERWLVGEVFEPLKNPSYFRKLSSTAVRSCGRTGRTSRPRHCTKRPRGPTLRRCSRRRRDPRAAAAERKRRMASGGLRRALARVGRYRNDRTIGGGASTWQDSSHRLSKIVETWPIEHRLHVGRGLKASCANRRILPVLVEVRVIPGIAASEPGAESCMSKVPPGGTSVNEFRISSGAAPVQSRLSRDQMTSRRPFSSIAFRTVAFVLPKGGRAKFGLTPATRRMMSLVDLSCRSSSASVNVVRSG